MAHVNIFEYDDNTHSVKIVNEALFLIPEFKELIRKDRTIGYKNREDRAMKEFTYMYLLYDIMTPFINHSETDKMKEAMSISGLSREDLEDSDFKKALKRYRELNDTPEMQFARSMKVALERNRKNIEEIDFTAEDTDMKKILDSFQSMEKALKTINNLMEEGRMKVMNGKIQGDSLPGYREDG